MIETPDTLLLDFGAVVSKSLFETVSGIEQAFALDKGSLDWSGPLQGTPDPLWQSMRQGNISERDYWYQRAQQLSAMVGESVTIQQIIRRSRPDIDAICRPEAVAAVRLVKESGATVAILTNELLLFYGSDRINQSTTISLFDHIFDASYTKILKPDPRAYSMVIAGLDIAPEQIMFIDDQIANVDGATRAGFHALHLDLNDPASCFDTALSRMGIG